MTPSPATKPKPATIGALIACVGAGCAAILAPFVSGQESGGKQHLTAYPDVAGVWTICDGDTQGVKRGDTETTQGCAIRLDKRLAGTAQAVVKRNPTLRGHDYQWAAATSLAYNIGTGAYASSTVAARFSAGQWRAACDAFLLWNRAGGRVVAGLANRRAAERSLCLKGL